MPTTSDVLSGGIQAGVKVQEAPAVRPQFAGTLHFSSERLERRIMHAVLTAAVRVLLSVGSFIYAWVTCFAHPLSAALRGCTLLFTGEATQSPKSHEQSKYNVSLCTGCTEGVKQA